MGTEKKDKRLERDVQAVDHYTRFTEEGPFHPPRIERIKREVTIGDDLTATQREEVLRLIEEFADIFALSVNEVGTVPGAVHRLNVPKDKSFPLKVHQRPLTSPQRVWLHKKIDELINADVIEPIHARDAKFAAPTVLAKKAYEGQGWSLNRLKRKVEDQFREAGYEPAFDSAAERDEEEAEEREVEKATAKWRICHNFVALNKHTEIAPMPQETSARSSRDYRGIGGFPPSTLLQDFTP